MGITKSPPQVLAHWPSQLAPIQPNTNRNPRNASKTVPLLAAPNLTRDIFTAPPSRRLPHVQRRTRRLQGPRRRRLREHPVDLRPGAQARLHADPALPSEQTPSAMSGDSRLTPGMLLGRDTASPDRLDVRRAPVCCALPGVQRPNAQWPVLHCAGQAQSN